jgi:hypothetical protein
VRIGRGPFLICHLLLVVTAVVWMPLGSRDVTGTSTVLPALHPVVHTTATGAVASATTNGDRRAGPAAIVMPAVLAGVAALVACRGVRRPTPDDHALRLRLVIGGLRSRAPPLAA